MPRTPNNKLAAIANQSSSNLKALILEAEEDILATIAVANEEAALHEKKPAVALSFTVSLDFDNDKATYCLSFGVRRKLTSEAEIPNPDQLNLPV